MLSPAPPPSAFSSLILLYLLITCNTQYALGAEFLGNKGNFATLSIYLFIFSSLAQDDLIICGFVEDFSPLFSYFYIYLEFV